MARLGDQQLKLLVFCARPTGVLLTTDKLSQSLVRRGLMREDRPGGACCITAAGLRALADALDQGRLSDPLSVRGGKDG